MECRLAGETEVLGENLPHGSIYLKARVYTNRPRTIQELKLSIPQEIAAVPEDMLENAMQNFEERLQMCVQQEGGHLTHIIFRT
jgi:hypothetical protein